MKKITFFGDTDIGKVKEENEDTFILQNLWDKEHLLAVAIDGLGGYAGGEVAAEIAKNSILSYLEKYPLGDRLDLLKQAVCTANNEIFTQREAQPQYANMSCVLTAILIERSQRKIFFCHVGDTRLYQYVNGELTKLSHDHSLVGYREEVGDLTEEEAMHHPQRNIISKDVGSTQLSSSDTDYIETAVFPLQANSLLLLCSDGLSDMLTSQQIKEILGKKRASLKTKTQKLIDAANEAGGLDNITVLLVNPNLDEELPIQESTEEKVEIEEPIREINPQSFPEEPTQPSSSPRYHNLLFAGKLLGIILLCVLLVLMGFWLGRNFGKIY